MDWQEEPATEQQLLRLQQYGFVQTCPLTITQAARLIRQYAKNSVSATANSHGPPSGAARSDTPALHVTASISDFARKHAHDLRLRVMAMQQAAEETPDRPGVRADLRACVSARQQFWLETCSDSRDLPRACAQALEFYQFLGARYFPPTSEQAQEVLDALDGAMPGWEESNPELFYETLKLNFPSLMRQR